MERNYPELDIDDLRAEEYAIPRAIARLRNKGMSAPRMWSEKLTKVREDIDSLTQEEHQND